MSPNDMRHYAQAIFDRKPDVDSLHPPKDLIDRLYRREDAKSGSGRRTNDRDEAIQNRSAPQGTPPQRVYMLPQLHPGAYQGAYQGAYYAAPPLHHYYRPHGYYGEPLLRHQSRPDYTSPLPVPHLAQAPTSSPVIEPQDPEQELKDFIKWQIERYPLQELQLKDAKEKLSAELYSIADVHNFKGKSAWEELEIPLGLGNRLQREAKTYIRQEMSRRRRGSLGLTPFTQSSKGEERAQEDTAGLDILGDAAAAVRYQENM